MFCQIGDPRKLEAILVIDQGDIDFVHEGQEVDLKFDALPHDTLHGRIAEIAQRRIEDHAAAALDEDRRRTGDEDGPEVRRGAAAEHVLPGPGADGRPGRSDAVWAFAARGKIHADLAAAGRRGSGGC